jgi:2-(1,2-epoxy-1,2-dihydrophenyl)acetyl-CoA isomerase
MTITLNSPDRLNAFAAEQHRGLRDALVAAADPQIRAVVLTGAGKGFCAGQDLSQLAEGSSVEDLLCDGFNPNALAMHNLTKPMVAAVNGVAAGAGISLAAACDVRIAVPAARFVPAFPEIGLVPDAGATYFLPRIVGVGRTFEWLSTNRSLGATEALAWGLVSEVVEPDKLLSRALEIAHLLARKPGVAIALTKDLLNVSWANTLGEQLEAEMARQIVAAEHPAHRAAVSQFIGRSGQAPLTDQPATGSPQ